MSKLRRAYKSWVSNPPDAQPQGAEDVHFCLRSPGCPLKIPERHAKVIVESMQYFAKKRPVTRPGVWELVRTYVGMLDLQEREQFALSENRPSDSCINRLMERHGLKYMSVQVVEDKSLEAITREVVSERIARLQAAIDRYCIRGPRFIFNTDQSGSSFRRMCGRSLSKGVRMKDIKLQQTCVRTKGQLERVTVMPCVSASGKAYKPVFVSLGLGRSFAK